MRVAARSLPLSAVRILCGCDDTCAEASRLAAGPDRFPIESHPGGERIASPVEGEMLRLCRLFLVADPHGLGQAELHAVDVFDDRARHGALGTRNVLGPFR